MIGDRLARGKRLGVDRPREGGYGTDWPREGGNVKYLPREVGYTIHQPWKEAREQAPLAGKLGDRPAQGRRLGDRMVLGGRARLGVDRPRERGYGKDWPRVGL